MKKLQIGDIILHFCGLGRNLKHWGNGAVLGISRVRAIGSHKGPTSQRASLVPGTQCIEYIGPHLSQDFFPPTLENLRRPKYPGHLEVHTTPVCRVNLPKLLSMTPQAYLIPIDANVAHQYLLENNVQLADLAHAANKG